MDERARLREALLAAFRAGGEGPWDEPRFERLALDVFRYQTESNPTYGRYARARGVDPDRPLSWRDVPPIPVRVFKDLPEAIAPSHGAAAVFRTSGTTTGRRGEHRVRDLSLYHGSLLASAELHLRGSGGRVPRRVLALLPSPSEVPDSSLGHMVGVLHERWDDGSGGFFADASWSLRTDDWERALAAAADDDTPSLVVGTAFSIVGWLEASGRGVDGSGAGFRVRLPEGSLVMETGGYKGRARSVPRAALHAALRDRLGVPREAVVSEYGMTEMLSQLYARPGRVAVDGGIDDPVPPFVGPPWLRTRVLDPISLAEVPAGERGLLCHVDLANLDSVSAILTEDEGVEVSGGIQLLGRIQGAEPRGCSLAFEELEAARR